MTFYMIPQKCEARECQNVRTQESKIIKVTAGKK